MPIKARPAHAQATGLARRERRVLHWKAKLFLLLGWRGRAVEVFRAVLARSPDDGLALNSLGYEALTSGQPGLALRYFERVVALAPDTSNAHFNLAFVCAELGRLEEAERGFQAALGIEPKMDRAWYGLGLVLVRQGRLGEALAAFQRNTRLQPMSPFGWYQLARVHSDLRQPEEARAVIRHLQGFEPKVAAQLEREIGQASGA